MIEILYVEDCDEDFTLFEESLDYFENLKNVHLTRATSSANAKKLIPITRFDLIIVDYELSRDPQEETGGDFVGWLIEKGIRLPTVVVSASAQVAQAFDTSIFLYTNVCFVAKGDLDKRNLWATITRKFLQPLKVLIVDDDADDQELLEGCLSDHEYFQYSITKTSTLENARTIQERDPPDVFLVDYMVGVRTSLDYIEGLLDKDPQCSVVLITGQTQIAQDKKAMRLLGRRKVAFLTKQAMNAEFLVHAINASRCKCIDGNIGDGYYEAFI